MTSGSSSIDQSTTIVIFGASGDLTQRKLIPFLCSLFCKDRLGPEVNIVGMARSNISTEEFQASLTRGIDAFEDSSPDTEELDEARKLYDTAMGCANDLGLLSEEFDSATGEMLGNFPQAFSHLAMINTAVQLQKASGGARSGPDRA